MGGSSYASMLNVVNKLRPFKLVEYSRKLYIISVPVFQKRFNASIKMSDDNKEKDEGEILMLEGSSGFYPFYMKQPTERMNRLFKKYETLLRKQLGNEVVGVYPMGSGAIPGMIGSPMIDILLVMKNSPPTEEQMEKLKELNIGLIGDGNSPHDKDDTWFQNLAFPSQDNFDEFKIKGEHPPDGHLGRLILHFSPHHSDWVRTVLWFVKYKMHKNDVAKQLLEESKKWMDAGNFKLPQE